MEVSQIVLLVFDSQCPTDPECSVLTEVAIYVGLYCLGCYLASKLLHTETFLNKIPSILSCIVLIVMVITGLNSEKKVLKNFNFYDVNCSLNHPPKFFDTYQ